MRERDRVRPPKDLEKVLDDLKEDKVFETKQKGMMFAAGVGFYLHRKEVDSVEVEPKGEGIRLEYFGGQTDDMSFIDALAVATKADLSVLSQERQAERIDLFEKYAMLGLQELKKVCYDDRPTDPLLGILALVDRLNRTGIDLLPGLKEML